MFDGKKIGCRAVARGLLIGAARGFDKARSLLIVSVLTVLAVLPAVFSASCTRHKVVDYEPPPVGLTISNIGWGEGAEPVEFDRVSAEIKGFEWSVITTVTADYKDGKVVLPLPTAIEPESLCKVARDNAGDYTGFWPARDVSDRDAKVAALGDIIAWNGDRQVGRLYMSGEFESKRYYVYFGYSDRPYTLSGGSISGSFSYRASFVRGWQPYYNVNSGGSSISVTTTLPAGISLGWKFEPWP
jgi:hypothetical protein